MPEADRAVIVLIVAVDVRRKETAGGGHIDTFIWIYACRPIVVQQVRRLGTGSRAAHRVAIEIVRNGRLLENMPNKIGRAFVNQRCVKDECDF